jgi:hypothetical protein
VSHHACVEHFFSRIKDSLEENFLSESKLIIIKAMSFTFPCRSPSQIARCPPLSDSESEEEAVNVTISLIKDENKEIFNENEANENSVDESSSEVQTKPAPDDENSPESISPEVNEKIQAEATNSNHSNENFSTQDDVRPSSDLLVEHSCDFIDRAAISSGIKTTSIARLKNSADQLNKQLENIKLEKDKIQNEIREKKLKLIEAIMKIVAYEKSIQEVEASIADKLHHFQSRIIVFEKKRLEIFLNSGDVKVHKLLEREIEEVKEEFKNQSKVDEAERDQITQHAQLFAVSLGDIFNGYKSYVEEILIELQKDENFEEMEKLSREFFENISQLQRLINRPAKYCKDQNNERFYLNIDKRRVYQIENYSSEYELLEGNREKIKDGFKLENDENGEFYFDEKARKVYTKFYFEDDVGVFYIDIHGDRHYVEESRGKFSVVNLGWFIKDVQKGNLKKIRVF